MLLDAKISLVQYRVSSYSVVRRIFGRKLCSMFVPYVEVTTKNGHLAQMGVEKVLEGFLYTFYSIW